MAKKTFVTNEIREAVGQCTKVSDSVMMYNDVERMGTCGACGHEIKNHFGIRMPNGTLMWVGSECVSTLCSEDKEETVAPGTSFNDGTRDLVSLTDEEFSRIKAAAWAPARNHDYGCMVERGWIKNNFLDDIIQKINRFSPVEKLVTVRQYDAIMKTLNS